MSNILLHVNVPPEQQRWRPFHGEIVPPPVEDAHAQELYDAYMYAQEHVENVDQAERDAQLGVRIADQAYRAEVERSAAAGEVSQLDQDLLQARESANNAAAPDIHEARRRAAHVLVHRASREYLDHIAARALIYTAALRPEAEKLAAEVVKINADAEKRLSTLRVRHAELLQAFVFVLGGVEGLTAADIASELDEPVALKPEAMRRLQGIEPEPAAPVETVDSAQLTTIGRGVLAF